MYYKIYKYGSYTKVNYCHSKNSVKNMLPHYSLAGYDWFKLCRLMTENGEHH